MTEPAVPELIGDDELAGYSVYRLMQEPDEGPVVRPYLAGRPVTAAERAAYQAFLLARGDVRGEVMALAEQLAGDDPPPDAAAKRARLTALVAQVDRAWWRTVRAQTFQLNCGAVKDRLAPVRFAFECPRTWEELTPTGATGVRHCTGCGEDVHRADTLIAAEALARVGTCITVPFQLAEAGGYPGGRPMITGRPQHPVTRWAERLFGPLPPYDRR